MKCGSTPWTASLKGIDYGIMLDQSISQLDTSSIVTRSSVAKVADYSSKKPLMQHQPRVSLPNSTSKNTGDFTEHLLASYVIDLPALYDTTRGSARSYVMIVVLACDQPTFQLLVVVLCCLQEPQLLACIMKFTS
jgi:hypothetical protein